MLAKRDMVPSMLDPAFEEEDCPSPMTSSIEHQNTAKWESLAERKSALELSAVAIARREYNSRFMAPMVKQKAQKDYRFMDASIKAASILGKSQEVNVRGIKEHAWLGVPADSDGRLIHHQSRDFLERFDRRYDEIKSDGLPCNVLEVPR